MKRSLVAVVLILVMLGSIGFGASAAEVRAVQVRPELIFDGTTATCKVSLTAVGKRIEATLELWYGSTLVDSWTASAYLDDVVTNYNLYLYNNSGQCVRSNSGLHNNEFIEFEVTETGFYTIKIRQSEAKQTALTDRCAYAWYIE